MKNKIYEIGIALGFISFGLSFFVSLNSVSLFALGFLILGLSCTYNYYFNNGKHEGYWWQGIFALCCFLAWFRFQFHINNVWFRLLLPFCLTLLLVKYFNQKKNSVKRNLPKKRF